MVEGTPETAQRPTSETVDQVVWSLARECRGDDVVIVGVATPVATAAVFLARELLVPDLTVIVAASVDPETGDIAEQMLRPETMARNAMGTFGQATIIDLIQRGSVTLQFVSPAQVDTAGRVNASRVPAPDGRTRRLPGALALPDVTALVGRLVAYRVEHSTRFLVPRVHFVTGAARSERPEPSWRYGAGVVAAVTSQALLRWDRDDVHLESVHSGGSAGEVTAGCGFPLLVPSEPATTAPPPPEATELLDRVIDPHRVRMLESRADRAAAIARLEAVR